MPCFQGVSINGSARLPEAAGMGVAAWGCSCVPVPSKSRMRWRDLEASAVPESGAQLSSSSCCHDRHLPGQWTLAAVSCSHLQQHREVEIPPWGLSWSLCGGTEGSTRYKVMLNGSFNGAKLMLCRHGQKKKELDSISEFKEMFEPVGTDSGSSLIISQAQPFKLGL